MAHGADLSQGGADPAGRTHNDACDSETKPVVADVAVFTSLPSSDGEGYRLVAASPGLGPDERRELLRRAPSHASLCGSDEHARAWALLPLESGRLCVVDAHHDGLEHTGRGGYRVRSHLYVLSAPDFRRLGCDPAPLLEAGRHVEVPRDSYVRTAGIAAVQAGSAPGWTLPSVEQAPKVEAVARLLWSRTAAVAVVGAGADEVLMAAWRALPAGRRTRELAVAAGLKFSPGRGVTLSLIHEADAVSRRQIVGADLAWLDLTGAPMAEQPGSAAPESWWRLLGRLWGDGSPAAAALWRELVEDVLADVEPAELDEAAAWGQRLVSLRLDGDPRALEGAPAPLSSVAGRLYELCRRETVSPAPDRAPA